MTRKHLKLLFLFTDFYFLVIEFYGEVKKDNVYPTFIRDAKRYTQYIKEKEKKTFLPNLLCLMVHLALPTAEICSNLCERERGERESAIGESVYVCVCVCVCVCECV